MQLNALYKKRYSANRLLQLSVGWEVETCVCVRVRVCVRVCVCGSGGGDSGVYECYEPCSSLFTAMEKKLFFHWLVQALRTLSLPEGRQENRECPG